MKMVLFNIYLLDEVMIYIWLQLRSYESVKESSIALLLAKLTKVVIFKGLGPFYGVK